MAAKSKVNKEVSPLLEHKIVIEISDYVKKYPNDFELGKEVRILINEYKKTGKISKNN